MAANVFPCEQLVYVGRVGGWAECKTRPARLVTFPRTPGMNLCAEHEREASEARARVTVIRSEARDTKGQGK